MGRYAVCMFENQQNHQKIGSQCQTQRVHRKNLRIQKHSSLFARKYNIDISQITRNFVLWYIYPYNFA